ncbi:hypothetical protein CDAR_201671 [Caerostris darwini]|uniref:Uncharacterized protein n=1 Tax=Caerostris darwini TaxID=1538125 RepID=A0AAV4QBS0_9ARAC|nr:hypothetical protein CDAR_201671 [Caerostris darwini]
MESTLSYTIRPIYVWGMRTYPKVLDMLMLVFLGARSNDINHDESGLSVNNLEEESYRQKTHLTTAICIINGHRNGGNRRLMANGRHISNGLCSESFRKRSNARKKCLAHKQCKSTREIFADVEVCYKSNRFIPIPFRIRCKRGKSENLEFALVEFEIRKPRIRIGVHH